MHARARARAACVRGLPRPPPRSLTTPSLHSEQVRFGPLGGVLAEERLMAAYRCGLRESVAAPRSDGGGARRSPRVNGAVGVAPLCSECAADGHWRDDCPALLLPQA